MLALENNNGRGYVDDGEVWPAKRCSLNNRA